MTEFEIDRHFGGTPCLCGEVGTWHRGCYAGKTKAEIVAAYKGVYRKLRRRIKSRAAAIAQWDLEQAIANMSDVS